MEVQEKNKCCDCFISQPKPDHYVEACKCEFDADLNNCGKKDIKRGIRSERLEDMNHHAETFTPNSPPPPNNYNRNNGAPGNAPGNNMYRAQQGQQQPQQCGQQAAQMQGCTEDPYAALGECVRECMLEKGEIARTYGIKCPDCDAPEEKSGKLQQADKPDKDDKAAKADKGAKAAKGGKADKGAKGGKADKGKKKKPEK